MRELHLGIPIRIRRLIYRLSPRRFGRQFLFVEPQSDWIDLAEESTPPPQHTVTPFFDVPLAGMPGLRRR